MIKQKRIIFVLVVLVLSFGFYFNLFKVKTSEAQAGWWNSSWGLRMRIDITSAYTGGSLSSVPMLVKLTNESDGFYFSDAASGGSDIRFIDSNGSTILDHEIESWNVNNQAYIWVGKPSASSGEYIYMYYDGPSGSYEDASGVWTPGYNAVWHLEESSGSVLDSANNYDSTGLSLTSRTATASIGSNAAQFNGNNYINWGNILNITTGNLTLEAWVKPDYADDASVIIGRKRGASEADEPGYQLGQSTSQSGKWQGSTSDGVDETRVRSSNGSVDTTSYTYLVFTYNGTEHRADLYQNAGLVGSHDNDAVGSLSNSDVFKAGQDGGGFNGFFGLIDELRFASMAHSPDWIEFQYCSMSQTCISYNSVETGNTSPNTPTGLTQSPGVEGSWTNDSTPYFNFTISDPNAGDTVGYQVQIDNNSDFSSPTIDYTWAGSTTNPNGVTYTVPAGSELVNGTYYWRVRTKDGAGVYSSWADDDNGFASTGVDFGVDVTAPSVTALSVNYATLSEHPLTTNDTTPTIRWTSQDNGSSGLKQIEVWRADDSGGVPTNWQLKQTLTTGVDSGSWSDVVSLGTYWYGVHVSDNSFVPDGYNCITEEGTHCGGVAGDDYDPRTFFGPIKVIVISGESPTADFTFCKLSSNYVYFTDLSSDEDGTVEVWDWEFGDGDLSSEQHPIHQYESESVYGVTLKVTDDDDLTDITSSSVDLSSAPSCSYSFLASVSVDCDTIGLAWEEAIGANSYEIYRAVNGGGYILLTTQNSDTACSMPGCNYDDLTVSEGNVYAYYLKAITAFHGYNNSTSNPNPACVGDEVDICPLANITPLCYPDSFEVISAPCGSIILSWEEVAGVDGYQLERSLKIDDELLYQQIGGGDLTETSYSDQEIISGVTYYYRVRSAYAGPEYSAYAGPIESKSYCYRGVGYSED